MWLKPSAVKVARSVSRRRGESNLALLFDRFVDAAFKNFFSRRNNGAGFPQFKSKRKDKWSYMSSYTNDNIRLTTVVNGKEIKNFAGKPSHIKLPKIGFVKCVVDRRIPQGCRILSAVVTKTRTNKYFVSISVEYEAEIPVLDLDLEKSLGLDYSQHCFYVDSQGMKAEYPKFLKKSESKLAHAQRALSRTKKGSKNRKKARLKVSLANEKISNQRKDWRRKKVHEIVENPDIHYVFIEDLSIKEMSAKDHTVKLHNGKEKKAHYGRQASDNSWCSFIASLDINMKLKGKKVLKIGKYFPSSKMCSNCGNINKDLTVEDRVYICPHCNNVIDRDYNAALNIKREGMRLVQLSNRGDHGVSLLNYNVRLES